MKKNVFKLIIIAVLVIGAFAATGIVIANKDITILKPSPPKVTIGHAVCDENGNLNGGKAGDQKGNEVFLRSWYSGWSVVLRAKNPKKAEIIADTMQKACANDNIGYDQYDRTTLFELAKKKKWRVDKITTPCETDCSALVAVCVNAAGIKVSKDSYTGNLEKNLMATGEFEAFTDSSYTESTENLQRGDILLKKGHTVVVVEIESDN